MLKLPQATPCGPHTSPSPAIVAFPRSSCVMGDKYDRQLRLWGAEGQRRLAQARVLLLGASATGAETLKNLVLPGVQRVTVLDDQKVTRADATNSFFVSGAAVGRARAQVVAELLVEMNADVAGDWRDADPLAVLQHEPEYLDQFALVIGSQLDEAPAELLGELCRAKRIPMLLVTSYGLFGYFRLQAAQHAIVDAKHDPPLHELRVSRPFPTLRAFADKVDLASLSSIDHAHVPFVVLLLKAMDAWKESHGGAAPATFPEKMAFKQSILDMAWGPPGHEVNFLEAADSAYRAYAAPLMPDEVASVLRVAKENASQFTAQTENFWWLARALGEFVETQNEGMLPVTGVVPDMTASTDTYVALQEIYVAKAAEDAAAVRSILQHHLTAAGIDPERISAEEVATFCKNSYNIAMLDTRSIAQEYAAVDLSGVDLEDEDQQQSPLIWYFMLRAVSSFVSTFHRYPGSHARSGDEDEDETTKQDQQWLLEKARQLATSSDSESGSQIAEWISDGHALEMTRSCEVELHNVAALMGGVASQEAVKLVTHQFVPLDHTYIFNGICGLAATYTL